MFPERRDLVICPTRAAARSEGCAVFLAVDADTRAVGDMALAGEHLNFIRRYAIVMKTLI